MSDPGSSPSPVPCRWCHGTKRITGCFFESWECLECKPAAPAEDRTKLPPGFRLVDSYGVQIMRSPGGVGLAYINDPELQVPVAWKLVDVLPAEVLAMTDPLAVKAWRVRNSEIIVDLKQWLDEAERELKDKRDKAALAAKIQAVGGGGGGAASTYAFNPHAYPFSFSPQSP